MDWMMRVEGIRHGGVHFVCRGLLHTVVNCLVHMVAMLVLSEGRDHGSENVLSGCWVR